MSDPAERIYHDAPTHSAGLFDTLLRPVPVAAQPTPLMERLQRALGRLGSGSPRTVRALFRRQTTALRHRAG